MNNPQTAYRSPYRSHLWRVSYVVDDKRFDDVYILTADASVGSVQEELDRHPYGRTGDSLRKTILMPAVYLGTVFNTDLVDLQQHYKHYPHEQRPNPIP